MKEGRRKGGSVYSLVGRLGRLTPSDNNSSSKQQLLLQVIIEAEGEGGK